MNGPTARWAGAPSGGTVFSAAGVWPLPAFLADGAQSTARVAPTRALGVPADQATASARESLAELADSPALDSAPGLWARRTPAPREEREAGLPTDALGVGFLAVHRETRLVVTAGWVTEPAPLR